MELQDFAPQHLVAQLAFAETQGSVLDHRGTIASQMAKHLELDNVGVQGTAAEVQSDDGRDVFRFGIGQVRASIRSFTEFDRALDRVRGFFEMALDYLERPAVATATVHTTDAAPVDSYEELRDALAAGIAQPSAALKESLGVPLADLGFSFRFEDPDTSTTHIQFEPMDEHQLAVFLTDRAPADYPAISLMLDVQTRLLAPDSGESDALPFWEKALVSNRRTTERTATWLTEAIS